MPFTLAAGPNDLTDVATARAWIGLPALPDSATDPVLQLAITAASNRIATWCSRTFVPTAATEVYDGVGGELLCLRRFPIQSIASVIIDGRAIPLTEPAALAPGISHDGRRTLFYRGGAFARGLQNISITYTAGLDPIPADLVMACLDWLKAGYASRDAAGEVTMRKAGDTAERYAEPIAINGRVIPMPPSVYAVVSQYVDVLPA